MPRFDPGPGEVVRLDFTDRHRAFSVVPHPQVPSMAHAMEGGKAMVFRLEDRQGGSEYALKIFKKRFREPELVRICQELDALKHEPGLAVCERVCLSPQIAPEPLQQFPELEYAVLMPWIAGRSWFDSLQTADAPVLDLNRKEARRLGTHLAVILASLESKGIAHCDLSAGNLLIDENSLKVDLIDVEDLYHDRLSPPAALPAGTSGYQHCTAAAGLWGATADRFAGAVLLAEILGWYDPDVRARVFGESYFDPGALQGSEDGDRYRVLHRALSQQSPALAELFEQAWRSSTLDQCPSLTDWKDACQSLFAFQPIPTSHVVIESGPKVFWGDISRTVPSDPAQGWEPISPAKTPQVPVTWDDSGVGS